MSGWPKPSLECPNSCEGEQPIVSTDGQIILTVNGEIYNYKELMATGLKGTYEWQTGSDCEVILYLVCPSFMFTKILTLGVVQRRRTWISWKTSRWFCFCCFQRRHISCCKGPNWGCSFVLGKRWRRCYVVRPNLLLDSNFSYSLKVCLWNESSCWWLCWNSHLSSWLLLYSWNWFSEILRTKMVLWGTPSPLLSMSGGLFLMVVMWLTVL